MKKIIIISIIYVLTLTAAHSDKNTIKLPSPKYKGLISVEEEIFNRKSIRYYKELPLTIKEVSQLLWAAGGVTGDGLTGATRAYPSAGACYPLRIYLVTGSTKKLEPGIYRYVYSNHSLKLLKKGDYRKELTEASHGQRMILNAPISIIFTAEFSRTIARYGKRGKERYVSMDLGHAGQNVHLQAEALGLGTVVVGAFNDIKVKKLLELADEKPLYIMPVGKR